MVNGLSELEKDINQINQDANAKGITMDENLLSDKLNEHPLYKDSYH